ncbi:MAG: M48 family metallopeptidase, partial [Bacteroidota bacterium]
MKDSVKSHKDIKAQFFTSSNYQIEKIIRSGNTLINDEVSIYLNEIANNILKSDPTLRSKISVYAFKSVVVNAYSYDKGYVFVDLGLIAQAETEAQLAYLLCHEIMHYVKNHQVNAFVNQDAIEKGARYEDKLVEKCQYSKELEGEADVEGFKLFEKSSYNPKQALNLFDVLQYSHLPFELIEFKKNFFETKDYILPASYFQNAVMPISNNSDHDDSQSTHPNTAKRKSVIAEKIKFAETKDKHNFIIGKEKFEYIRDLARLELCRLYLKNRDYPNALYAAYILKQKFPNNKYVEEVICKCLYAISLYRNNMLTYGVNSYLPDGFPSSSSIEGFPQQLYHFINNFPANELTIMALNYVYRTHKKIRENKQIQSCSDSLLVMMSKINWGISDFNRDAFGNEVVKDTSLNGSVSKTDYISKMQKTINKEDSVYYRNVFRDLLSTDKYFSEKFPSTAPAINSSSERVTAKKKSKTTNPEPLEISKVLFLEPFYYKLTEKDKKQIYKYVDSDIMQEKFLNNFISYAAMQKFELVTFDPGVMTAAEIAKMNDYSVLNDWLFEKFDSDNENNMVFNTNEVENLIARYSTKYVLKTGVVSEKSGIKNRIFIYVFVIDIHSNKLVYSNT